MRYLPSFITFKRVALVSTGGENWMSYERRLFKQKLVHRVSVNEFGSEVAFG